MLDAVTTSCRVAGTHTSSANVDFFNRVKRAPFIRDRLSTSSKALKPKPYVSGLREFLKGRAVIQGTRSTVHQVSMDLKGDIVDWIYTEQNYSLI